MGERIGVYVCQCGPNIGDRLNTDELVGFARNLDHVATAKTFGLLCSSEGKTLIAEDIAEEKLTRVVVAACSPKEHEATFREILEHAGLNPFLLQVANIREQDAWVTEDKALATHKARAAVRAAVQRVLLHEPLEVKKIACRPDVMVVGAGVAGVSAALALAQKNRKVYLVETLPCLGGKVARYEGLFPRLECASCVLDPLLDGILHNEQIEVLTLSDVQQVLGCYGNFMVRVRRRARFVDSRTCVGCGACFDVCPVRVSNEYNEGLDRRSAIYIPYAGALPNVAVIDSENCLRRQDDPCRLCQEACPFGSVIYEDKDEDTDIHVGAVVLATGFNLFDPGAAPQYGYGKIENIYTSLEFERLIDSSGPTQGKILLKNGQPPGKIAFVHCVGSRTREFHEHCSGVCCTYLLKFAHQARRKLPGVSISEIYSDFCLPGKEAQGFFNRVSEEDGIDFIRVRDAASLRIAEADRKILIKYADFRGETKDVKVDMVVLAPAMEGGRDAGRLAEIFGVSVDKSRFFVEDHCHVAPVSTSTEGVFVAGCAQGPRDIQASVAQGQAAAGRILSGLVPGEMLSLGPITAVVDDRLCSGCKVCIGLCPYQAIHYDDGQRKAMVNELLCRGCGICPAACPGGAIVAKHFTDEQLWAEIEGLLQVP